MSITNYNYKKRSIKTYKAVKDPHSQNPIYQRKIYCFGCPFCGSKSGRKKRFSTLWLLHIHMVFQHKRENYRDISMTLADFIIRGIIF